MAFLVCYRVGFLCRQSQSRGVRGSGSGARGCDSRAVQAATVRERQLLFAPPGFREGEWHVCHDGHCPAQLLPGEAIPRSLTLRSMLLWETAALEYCRTCWSLVVYEQHHSQGGELIVQHGDRTKICDHSGKEDCTCWAAFYAGKNNSCTSRS